MSSEFDRDMHFFEVFHGYDQNPLDFNEFCHDGDYELEPAPEAQTLHHPAADAGNELSDPDASVGVSEPNQASLHEGPSAMLLGSNQSDGTPKKSVTTVDMEIASSGSAAPWYLRSSNTTDTTTSSAGTPPGPPYKCTEANCRSKAQWKTLSQFTQHIRNIHQQPLLCTVPGCTHQRPFGKQTDLNRHVKTKHEATETFLCGDESCPAHVHGFERKDKLLKHLREHHPQVQCTKTHCSAIVADFQQQSHMEQDHGPFECALGHCRTSPPSNFTQVRLHRHLKNHHKLSYDCIETIKSRMQSSDLDARSEHLRNDYRRPKWEICSICEIGGATAHV
ncbi:unnamed protein product [Clonostachys byssicola]|uniref:C2H2-type domain-containing protein n=1 Tax=Clonostachys byssicola TaxID=160290 RepID=A0A9N9U824_9HYPO|nr:unnamed protein product [Clonostachys byssicola]